MRPSIALLCMALALLPAAAVHARDDSATSGLAGTIFDAAGTPIPACRVVARVVDSPDVFISAPSDNEGGYFVAVPSGRRYVVVALISPTGARVAMPADSPLLVDGDVVRRDLRLPMVMPKRPRKDGKMPGGVDRMFFSFIEDPALVGKYYVEVQAGAAEFDAGDRLGARFVAAAQFAKLPRVELGLRGGWAELSPNFGLETSGMTDAEAWAKLHLLRTADTRMDLAVGAVLTFPTGDSDERIGRDALQSKLFMAMSYSLPTAAIVMQMGMRATENGEIAGVPIEGRVSPSAGLGVVVPMTDTTSLVFEAAWDGERFERANPEGRVAVGVNWRATDRGRLRAAIAAGLEDGAPDVEVLAGWAVSF